jgi:D-xylose transport system substrate-binding protein
MSGRIRSIRPVPLITMVAAVALTAALAACGGAARSSGPDAAATPRVALLLPELAASRYENADRPYFTQVLTGLCPRCSVVYRNAAQDAAKQYRQAVDALDEGVRIIVLDPVDSRAAGDIVAKAHTRNVPVISYDRLVLNSPVDDYVSFDNRRVGVLQGQALLSTLGGKASNGEILWLNGSPADHNAALFKLGAHSVLDGKVRIAAETDIQDWNPDTARAWAQKTIAGLNGHRIVGVYAANDGLAGAAIAALKSAGRPPVPVTGQDAEIGALQRILTGDQYMTVYKSIQPEAERAAQLAFDRLRGMHLDTTTTVDNGAVDVPAILLDPAPVTRANIASTVVKDGFVKPGDLCAGAYAEACRAAGIKAS